MAQFGYAEPHMRVGSFFSTRSQRGQHCMSQHGQRDMPIPALSVAHLVVIQSAFTFSRLKGLLDQPALSGHSDQSFNRVFTAGGVTQIVSALWLLFDAAPYQKRPRPTILFRQWHQRPFVEPFALAIEAGGKAFPFSIQMRQTPRTSPLVPGWTRVSRTVERPHSWRIENCLTEECWF